MGARGEESQCAEDGGHPDYPPPGLRPKGGSDGGSPLRGSVG